MTGNTIILFYILSILLSNKANVNVKWYPCPSAILMSYKYKIFSDLMLDIFMTCKLLRYFLRDKLSRINTISLDLLLLLGKDSVNFGV